MNVLVTGGTGYIGSHTCVELLQCNHDVIIVDDLSNSKADVIDHIEEITKKRPTFYQLNILEEDKIEKVFQNHTIDCIIHFAGFKAVGESVEKPIEYYYNNITTTLILTKLMKKYNCKKFIFSSSATVYGNPKTVPILEDFPLGPTTNPYGTSKLMLEQMLTDIQKANNDWTICLLRYFNPIGSHESGLLGEDPKGIPNNLMPYIMKVASKNLPSLGVFGNDYDTPDGTGVRDYIHVVDLAKGHVAAFHCFNQPGVKIYNLGTGKGYSVLEVVSTFEKVNNLTIPYEIKPRRAGDIATCFADATKAKNELHWQAEKELEDMCRDAWNYAKKHY